MATPLSHVPGLGGFLAAQQQQDQQEMMELQRAATLGALLDKARAAQQQQAFRSAMAGATTPEAQQQVAMRFASPEQIIQSGDRRMADETRREIATNRETVQRDIAGLRAEAAARQEQMLHEFRMAQTANAEQRAAETERHNKAVEALNAQVAAMRSQQQEKLMPVKGDDGRVIYLPASQAIGRQVGSRTTDVNIERQVQQLGKDFEKAGLPQMIPVVERAMQITPEQAKFITGPGALLPDRAVPQDIREARQSLQKLFNITLKDRSGAAVTYQELERLKQEFGAGLLKTPEQLLNAIREARNIVESHYTGVGASYGKEVLEGYNRNLEGIGGTPFQVRGQGVRLTPTQPGASQPQQAPSAGQGPKEGDTSQSKSGKPIVFRGGKWVYQ